MAALDAARAVRARLGLDRMALGLWLARPAATSSAAPRGAVRLARARWPDAGSTLFTLNGFPYGNFHAPSR